MRFQSALWGARCLILALSTLLSLTERFGQIKREVFVAYQAKHGQHAEDQGGYDLGLFREKPSNPLTLAEQF